MKMEIIKQTKWYDKCLDENQKGTMIGMRRQRDNIERRRATIKVMFEVELKDERMKVLIRKPKNSLFKHMS
jgi:hypothetical protein